MFLRHLLLLLLLAGAASAQESFNLQERFTIGTTYQVRCRVQIQGDLEHSGKKLPIVGSSDLDYDEKILELKNGAVDRTLRLYRKIEFERQVGDQKQESTVRPEVRRMVILRHRHVEVPFCPVGPMMWNELDLIRTDVFTPALAGFLPRESVKPGSRWNAETASAQELTDLDQFTRGGLQCEFRGIETPVGTRRQARIQFHGTLEGIGEDGPTEHDLDGYLFFDLESSSISYLYVKGVQTLKDKDGKGQGKITGSFTLTRQPISPTRELSDDGVRGLALTPNDDNTALLYDNPELGVRFLYPRRWRVGTVKGTEITLDEKNGSGLVMLLEPLSKFPPPAQFQFSVYQWLDQQKAKILHAKSMETLQSTPTALQHFGVSTEMKGQRVWLDYYLVRQTTGGVTLSARLLPHDLPTLQADVARIARSLVITRQQN